MNSVAAQGDGSRWRTILIQLEERLPEMADEFVARLNTIEGYDSESDLVDPQDARGITQLVGYELMVVPPSLCLIPAPSPDQPLPPTDGAPCDVEGHGLERLACEQCAASHGSDAGGAPRAPPS